jgi:hypothetical protein
MLLRRVIVHVKAQNWTAVALDFFIVVAGVFVGIQLGNWNEARLTRIAAGDYEERLLADLRLEGMNFQALINYYDDVLRAAGNTHDSLVGNIELSNTDLLINAFRASQYSWADRHRATFDELVASGNLDLIYDTQLRTQVTAYYAMELLEEISRDSQNSEYRRAFRKTIPPEIHKALQDQCGDRQIDGAPPGFVTLRYKCAFEWPQGEVDDVANILRSNGGILPLLRLQIANLNARNYSLQQQWEVYRQTLDAAEEGPQ